MFVTQQVIAPQNAQPVAVGLLAVIGSFIKLQVGQPAQKHQKDYRRGQEQMSASDHEQEHAASAGVRIIHNAAPVKAHGNGKVAEIEFAYTEAGPDGLKLKTETFRLKADQVMKAIGQTLTGALEGLKTEGGKIAVTGAGRTSIKGVWAAGDCASGGEDLTVTAVAEGRDAAEDIHGALSG